MEKGNLRCTFWFMLLLNAMLLGQLGEGKSIAPSLKKHSVQKRYILEETCPPPYEYLDEKCNDTCADDDQCLGTQMCCYDGCAYSCMEPLPSVPVVDWLDYGEIENEVGIPETVAEPIIESSVCTYDDGKTLEEGESYSKGCYYCQCLSGNIMCEVGQCRLQARVPSTGQVSGEGPDESSGDEELKARKESSGFAREVLGQPSEDDEHNEIARDELEEGSGLGDDGTSEDFVAYKSVKLKQQQ